MKHLIRVICTLLVIIHFGELQITPCLAPNGKVGECILIWECQPLLDILFNIAGNSKNIQFLRDFQCGFHGKSPKVCCLKSQQIGNILHDPLLPSDCGRQLIQQKFGERANIGEYPWMAHLEYRGKNGIFFGCGGTLISNRYVLTAGHCLKTRENRNLNIVGVRLGEHGTDSDQDCIQDNENSVHCADPSISVGIEEIIIHPNYDALSPNQTDDIALLRLKRNVTFTDFIKPICLPTVSVMGQYFFATAWCRTENGSQSNIKLNVKLFDFRKGKRHYNTVVKITNRKFCSEEEKRNDTCKGDSGGPVMSVELEQNGVERWIMSGLVSRGPLMCDDVGLTVEFTRVSEYNNWIVRNLRR